MAKKRGKRTSRASSSTSSKNMSPEILKQRTSKALKNLIIFLGLFIVSMIFWKYSSNVFWVETFFLLTAVFGFLALAFLISWLVLLMVGSKKR